MKPAGRKLVEARQYEHPLIDAPELVCNTCYLGIQRGTRVTLEANETGPPPLPDLPPELLGLSLVENLLISPRVVFQRLQERPCGGQVAIKGWS